MFSVSLGLVDGEAIRADCGCADAGPQRAIDAIAPLPNNVAQMSSGCLGLRESQRGRWGDRIG